MNRLNRFFLTPAFLLGMMLMLSPARATEFADLSYPAPVKFLKVSDSLEIAYVEAGNGPQTLIMIHGLGSYLPAWQENWQGLQEKYRCIAIDLPGYGKSGKPIAKYNMRYFAEVVKDFMTGLGIEKAAIAGHSMGGQIAITLALSHPEMVSALVLVAPAGLETFTEGEKAWFRKVMTVDGVKATPVNQIRANLAGNFYNLPENAHFMIDDRIAMRSASDFESYCYAVVWSVHGMVDQPVHHRLKDLTQPTLIIFGANDNLIPNPYLHGGKSEEIGKIGRELIPNATLEMIPEAGHFVMFEKAGVVNEKIAAFLK
ncbi:MAG TPA: alpha/beta hydrolase [Calditrichia bacterium]|nr:alpha/beta hydrolase [Calditrichota bacterium]HQV33413.1 alpha/beta hydrolase [Calditrichia bacterium]